MSHLVQFIEDVRQSLTADEWEFFNARYFHGRGKVDASMPLPALTGDALLMQRRVMRKLRNVAGVQ
jgi:hypothetical protein